MLKTSKFQKDVGERIFLQPLAVECYEILRASPMKVSSQRICLFIARIYPTYGGCG